MASVDILTMKNEKTGSRELDPVVFEAKVRPHLYHAEVRRQLADRRAGTHSTRNRALVSGGGAKPYRQKGTGRARQGTTRAPQWAGGGVVFGPVPRSYAHKIPKKVRRAALLSALTERSSQGAITVVENLAVDGYSTKQMAGILSGLELMGKKVLIVLAEPNVQLEASARNIPGITVIRSEGVNVYDVLRHDNLLVTQPALEALETRLKGKAKGVQA